jgi:hypothetical protein
MPKGPQGEKRHAVRVTPIAIDEELKAYVPTTESEGKDPAAVALGRRGGRARAERLSARNRKEIAQKAAKSRWARHDRKAPAQQTVPIIRQRYAAHMSESSSRPPLLKLLIRRFRGKELAPPRSSLEELSEVAERLVPLYLQRRHPLRRAAVAKKLTAFANNLTRAAKTAAELGEEGMSQVLLASEAYNPPESEPINLIAGLQDLAQWSARAAETAQQMSLSVQDHRGGRTPDVRLRSLVTTLMNRYELLVGIKASHVVDPATGLGHSTFDLFVKQAIELYAPAGLNLEPRHIDDAIRRALPSRASHFWGVQRSE